MKSTNKKQLSNSNDLSTKKSDLSQESYSENESLNEYSSSSESEFMAKYKPKSKFFQNPDLFHIRYSSSEPSLDSISSESEADQPLQLNTNLNSKANKVSPNKCKNRSKSRNDSNIKSDLPDASSDTEIEKIIGINQPNFDESSVQLMFYVKYKGKSYKMCEWIDKDSLVQTKKGKMLHFILLRNEPPFYPVHFFNQTVSASFDKSFNLFKPAKVEFDEGFIIPEKIISIQSKEDETKYLVKWFSLDVVESTWETDVSEDLIEQFEENNSFMHMSCYEHAENKDVCDFVELKESPVFKNENLLADYQVDGLNWLQLCWFKNENSILADETGLGKTIESISMIECLSIWYPNWGPFLIVCPVSKISKWLFELKNWTNFRVVCMTGNQESLNMIKKYLIYHQTDENGMIDKDRIIFDVILISYENLTREINFISKLNFMYTIIDEAQRIKNYQTKIYQNCMSICSYHKLLMTGTPIQNNVCDIWSLLHYIDPSNFNDFDAFKNSFDFKNDPEAIDRIQEVIKPYTLRRTKSDINIESNEKEEKIIEVEMTQIQRNYSQLIYRNNLQVLNDNLATKANLDNITMQFEKLFCHPFLISKLIDICYSNYKSFNGIPKSKKLNQDQKIESLIFASGKTILIDKFLPKLKEENHKVLIFSQTTKILDIIEDYLNYKGYLYERLDGNFSADKRMFSINRFQNDDDVFVCLLSTHSGGIGINLTGADTVIIYDGDWTPNRICQTRKHVDVFRLITRRCYESEIFLRESQKLAIGHEIIDDSNSSFSEDQESQLSEKEMKKKTNLELQKILRKSAYYTFNNDEDEIDKFCSESIDQILDHRSYSWKDLISRRNSKASFDEAITDDEINKKDFWNKLIGIKSSDDDDVNGSKTKQNKYESSSITSYSYSDDEDDDDVDKSSLSSISFPQMEQNLYSKLTFRGTKIIRSIASNVNPIFQTTPKHSSKKETDPQAVLNYYLKSISESINRNLNAVQNKSIDPKDLLTVYNCIKKHGIYSSRFFLSEFLQEVGKRLFLAACDQLPSDEYRKHLNDIRQYIDERQELRIEFPELNQLSSLFKGKELEFVLETLKRDAFYKAAVFISNEKLPENFQFGPEMDTPIGWSPINDFLIITLSPFVETISDIVKDEKLPFTKIVKDFPSLNQWISDRFEFILKEISLLIPLDYNINEEVNRKIVPKKFGNVEKFKELNYHVVYPQKLSVCLQKKLLRVFYLYGIPKENGIQKIKSILKIESLDQSELNQFDKNRDLILIFAVKILIKAIKYKPDLCNLLKSLNYFDVVNDDNINCVDIRWIKEEAIQSVASNLDLIFKVRENYPENHALNDLTNCEWWDLKHDKILFKITAYYGFLFNSMFCKFIPSKEIDDNVIDSWRNEEILRLSPIEHPKMNYLGQILSFDKKKERLIQILDFINKSNKE